MKSKAVIGMGFGDEGKGATTDWLCSLNPSSHRIVQRYSGGQQAGHNVIVGGTQHIFSNFGSGTIRGVISEWSKRCTINPVNIMNEYNVLISKQIETPFLVIHPECPITTPVEVHKNRSNEDTLEHGTCGMGFFETLKREWSGHHIQAYDILFPDILKRKIDQLGVRLSAEASSEFNKACEFIRNSTSILIMDNITESMGTSVDETIYEGSQGLLLDQHIGFFPHVTPSSVGTKNLPDDVQAFFVTRAYQTRHGNGPMSNHLPDFEIMENPLEINVDTGHQGKFRRSVLDLDLLEYGLMKDGGQSHDSHIVVTCVEHLNDYRYYYGGQIHTHPTKEDFCIGVAMQLGFDKENVIMCENHVFTPLYHEIKDGFGYTWKV